MRASLEEDLTGQQEVIERLTAAGIDMERVAQQLEDEGVQAFAASFDKVMGSIREHAATIHASDGRQPTAPRGRRGRPNE